MDSILLLAALFLLGGVIAVPIASRLGLGSVLGYLIAGIGLSPVLRALHVDVVAIQHFAEFGVVMMLFLVGLELEPRMLWAMRARLLGLGGLQVVLTASAIAGVAVALGQPWTIAMAIGLILSLSSTAIVLQTLNEKGLMRSDGGQASFSVLLFQDIAVIPMLAFIPLLVSPELAEAVSAAAAAHGSDEGHGSYSLVDRLEGWQAALVTAGAIATVVVGGNHLTRPVFRFIAMARLRELFTAAALLLVIGIALLMSVVGLSPALGTFLGGVVLANSEYRHELESDIDPFKGLLLGLFFITVGAAIRFDLLAANLWAVLGMTAGLMGIKALVLYVLGRAFGIAGGGRWLFMGLSQAGEFGFVLLSFTVSHAVIPAAVADRLMLVVTLSMLLTPALFIAYDKLIAPRLVGAETRQADPIEETGTVIIAGHGRFGGVINRILRSAGVQTVVVDYRSEQLDLVRRFGIKVHFGDAMRPDLLHAAGIDRARMLVIAIDDRENITELVRHVTHNHPNVYIVARAVDRHHVYELWGAGARDIIRETFDSSVRAGRSALEALGIHPYDAERQVRGFVLNDRKQMRDLAELYDPSIPVHENAEYVARTKEYIARTEQAMKGNSAAFGSRLDRGWVPPTLADVKAERETASADDPTEGRG